MKIIVSCSLNRVHTLFVSMLDLGKCLAIEMTAQLPEEMLALNAPENHGYVTFVCFIHISTFLKWCSVWADF